MSIRATFSYFQGMEGDMYQFYRIPKLLFTSEYFKNLSCEAKVLYGLMLDRMSLSIKNRWLDEEDRVYIFFSVEEIMEMLNCGRNKAVNCLKELDQETGIGLIEKKRLGLGKTESYPSIHHDRNDVDKMDERYAYRQIICENIEYDILCQSYKPESVEELVELMLDAICTTKKYLQINGEAMPAQVVKNRLLKVGYEHIQYVFFSLSKNTTKVKNIRQYMLTVLYNAPVTINQFYDAEVRHDMYGG